MTHIFWKTPNGQQAMYVSHYEHIKELVEAQERMIKIAQENQEEHDIYVIADRSNEHSHTTLPDKLLCVGTIRKTKEYEITCRKTWSL